jgi:hypothetical protein
MTREEVTGSNPCQYAVLTCRGTRAEPVVTTLRFLPPVLSSVVAAVGPDRPVQPDCIRASRSNPH